MMDKEKFYNRIMDMPLEERKSFLYAIYLSACEYFAKVFIHALKK